MSHGISLAFPSVSYRFLIFCNSVLPIEQRVGRISPMNETKTILVVDDDPAIAELVVEVLEPFGMRVVHCLEGTTALTMLEKESFDLVILDVMMPGIDGYEVCFRIRARSHVPVIFLSAKDEETDKVLGLMSGGDDYITKPFLPRELVARVKSCLRRASYDAHDSETTLLQCRGLEVDCAAHTASLHGQPLVLTPKEFDMLAQLLVAHGRPVSTRDLYESVWHEQYLPGNSNSVMVHIRHLRAKLARVDSQQEFIQTVWGVGYKIVP